MTAITFNRKKAIENMLNRMEYDMLLLNCTKNAMKEMFIVEQLNKHLNKIQLFFFNLHPKLFLKIYRKKIFTILKPAIETTPADFCISIFGKEYSLNETHKYFNFNNL